MTKYALCAAVAALALGAPGAVHAQPVQLAPGITPPHPVATRTSTTTTVTTTGMRNAGGANDRDFGLSGDAAIDEPDLAPLAAVPPGAVWIPGHYDWSAARRNYVWLDGRFTLPPHPDAQWVAGHWQETPSSWVWVDGRWN